MDNVENAVEVKEKAPQLKPFRFSSTNQPAKRGRPKGSSPTEYLRQLSSQKIHFLNPLTGQKDYKPVSYVVAIQLILKATQDSDLPSIKEFIDRLDGKMKELFIDQSQHKTYEVTYYNGNGKDTSSRVSGIDTPLASRSPENL